MRPVQYFSKDYLAQRRPRPVRSRLISMKVPQDLLDAFRAKAQAKGVAYQAQIKRLMSDWLAT